MCRHFLHTDISAGKNFTAHATESVNLFAQSNGAKLQANQGKVEIQAQNDELQLNALKDAVVTSSAGKVTIAAKEEILLTSGGAYIRIKDGEVEIGCPTVVRVRCMGLAVTGPRSMAIPAMPLFEITGIYRLQYHFEDDDGIPYRNKRYTATLANYQQIEGTTDENGMTQIFYSENKKPIKVHLHLDEREK